MGFLEYSKHTSPVGSWKERCAVQGACVEFKTVLWVNTVCFLWKETKNATALSLLYVRITVHIYCCWVEGNLVQIAIPLAHLLSTHLPVRAISNAIVCLIGTTNFTFGVELKLLTFLVLLSFRQRYCRTICVLLLFNQLFCLDER